MAEILSMGNVMTTYYKVLKSSFLIMGDDRVLKQT